MNKQQLFAFERRGSHFLEERSAFICCQRMHPVIFMNILLMKFKS